MTRFPSRPGDTNQALLVTVGVLVGLVVAGLIIFSTRTMRPADTSVDVTIGTTSSARSSSAAAVQPSGTSASQQAAIDACINAATEAHTQRWATACGHERVLMERAYTGCLQKNEKTYCEAQFGSYATIDDDCQLPVVVENALNIQFSAAKTRCQS